MILTGPAERRAKWRLPLAAACLAFLAPPAAPAALQTRQPPRVLLRVASDSNVVGHYRFTVRERRRLVFDIAADDPRAALLQSATVPKETVTDIAATIVSTPTAEDEERRYLAYWLGFKLSGDDVRGLTPLQWDSIFQEVGRRAVLRFSPTGQPQGVEVGSEAVKPVGRALARTLSAMALALPKDSVAPGSRWENQVAVPLTAPDGSERLTPLRVRYHLRDVEREPDDWYARIEFDGEPLHGTAGVDVSGRYFGESVFAVKRGRYERMLALANLEVAWADTTGLPPSRTVVEWRGEFTRH